MPVDAHYPGIRFMIVFLEAATQPGERPPLYEQCRLLALAFRQRDNTRRSIWWRLARPLVIIAGTLFLIVKERPRRRFVLVHATLNHVADRHHRKRHWPF